MIDKTAIIHPSAQIADDAIIGPYVVIGEGVKIGSGTRVISNAHIEHAEIGKNCTISPFATIGSEPQDLGYKGEDTKVVIGDEMLTPDSSRFWPLEGYKKGQGQPSYDKQLVRNWLLANPDSDYLLPDDIIDKTVEKYKEAYKLLTGEDF